MESGKVDLSGLVTGTKGLYGAWFLYSAVVLREQETHSRGHRTSQEERKGSDRYYRIGSRAFPALRQSSFWKKQRE